jgi:large subunit ribosomal protein L4
MKLKLYNLEKKVLDEIEVNNPLYETEVRVDLMHRVVVWQMAKRRLGTRKAKNRSGLQTERYW